MWVNKSKHPHSYISDRSQLGGFTLGLSSGFCRGPGDFTVAFKRISSKPMHILSLGVHTVHPV